MDGLAYAADLRSGQGLLAPQDFHRRAAVSHKSVVTTLYRDNKSKQIVNPGLVAEAITPPFKLKTDLHVSCWGAARLYRIDGTESVIWGGCDTERAVNKQNTFYGARFLNNKWSPENITLCCPRERSRGTSCARLPRLLIFHVTAQEGNVARKKVYFRQIRQPPAAEPDPQVGTSCFSMLLLLLLPFM